MIAPPSRGESKGDAPWTSKGISPDLREKARDCKTPEEMVELAKEAGIELSEEQLDAIAGGGFWDCEDEPCVTAWHA